MTAKLNKPPFDLFLTGRIEDETVREFQIKLRKLQTTLPASQKIRINISSEGGNIELSYALVSQVHEYRRQGRFFITHCAGQAYSGGLTLLQAGDHRTIDSYGTVMTHSPQVELEHWTGSLSQCYATVNAIKQIGEKCFQIVADRSGLQVDFLRDHFFNGEDNYFDAEVALELNLVDEIVAAP